MRVTASKGLDHLSLSCVRPVVKLFKPDGWRKESGQIFTPVHYMSMAEHAGWNWDIDWPGSAELRHTKNGVPFELFTAIEFARLFSDGPDRRLWRLCDLQLRWSSGIARVLKGSYIHGDRDAAGRGCNIMLGL